MALRLRTILPEGPEGRAVDFPDGIREIRIGRRQDLELPLPFRALSTIHARLLRDEGELWWVEDLGSRNGTGLDGLRLAPGERRLLTAGSRIELAIVTVVFEGPITEEPRPPSPPPEGTGTIARRLVNDLLARMPGAGAPTLTVLHGAAAATLRLDDLDHRYIVGRGEGAALQIVADEISREHAALTRTWEAVTIEDLGSKNGVRVNGARVPTLRVRDGDVVEVGPVSLQFSDPADRYLRELENQPDPPPAAPEPALPAAPDEPPGAVPSEPPARGSRGARAAIVAAGAVLLAICAAALALAIGAR